MNLPAPIINQIVEQQERIAQLEAELAEARKLKRCQNCKNLYDAQSINICPILAASNTHRTTDFYCSKHKIKETK